MQVVYWSCVWMDNATSLNSSWIGPCFLWEKLALCENEVKISRFVNQSNINKPEFDLTWIRLKHFRFFCVDLRLFRFKNPKTNAENAQPFLTKNKKIELNIFQTSSTWMKLLFYYNTFSKLIFLNLRLIYSSWLN